MALTDSITFYVAMFFATFSVMLFSYTWSNVMRLRHIRLTWNAGRFLGYPIFSTAFSLCLIAALLILEYKGFSYSIPTAIAYGLAGTAWFWSSFFVSRRYITERGIVKNVNDPVQTIPWLEVVDFVEKTDQKEGHIFSFFYLSYHDDTTKTTRLDLPVPKAKYKDFKRLVELKLERRFNKIYRISGGQAHINF